MRVQVLGVRCQGLGASGYRVRGFGFWVFGVTGEGLRVRVRG